jgi:hypothetical protein
VKRKASLIDVVESPRDKKRLRDESEPAEEDEPGLLCGSVDVVSHLTQKQVQAQPLPEVNAAGIKLKGKLH